MNVTFNTISSNSTFGAKKTRKRYHKQACAQKPEKDVFTKTQEAVNPNSIKDDKIAAKKDSGLNDEKIDEYVEYYFLQSDFGKETIRMLLQEQPEKYGKVIEKIEAIEVSEAAKLAQQGTIKGFITDMRTAVKELLELDEEPLDRETAAEILNEIENCPVVEIVEEESKTSIFQGIVNFFSKK